MITVVSITGNGSTNSHIPRLNTAASVTSPTSVDVTHRAMRCLSPCMSCIFCIIQALRVEPVRYPAKLAHVALGVVDSTASKAVCWSKNADPGIASMSW